MPIQMAVVAASPSYAARPALPCCVLALPSPTAAGHAAPSIYRAMRVGSTLRLGQRVVALPLPASPLLPWCSRAECVLAWHHQSRQQQQQQQQRQRRWHRHQRRQQRAGPAAASAAPSAEPAVAAGTTSLPARQQVPSSGAAAAPIQTFDYTALAAAAAELQAWVPAKVEAVVQQDTGTALRLRTVTDNGALQPGWLSFGRPRNLAICLA
jgi:hypothetical protein